MEFDRYSGKTLDEALAAACSAKNAAVEELTYTVVEEKAGFLGLGRTVTIEAWAPVDIIVFLNDYIRTYFENAEMDGSVSIELDEDDFYRIQVDTNCNAVLIGRQGRTLQDFNRLVRAAASAVFKKHIRLMIDINGYKEERYEKVTRMAIRIARDVRRTKVDAVLDPMPADERKAIHSALSDMEDISTNSEGEGMERRLHILYTPGKNVE
ncbi:protein jag [Allobaculum mucilyticum]|uniref:Jag family protein n=1 Tax=Allobaculum mucilyticum TaxID=2834459 RepID=UPI001E3A679B|nr:R3H domain-containing nucleic acid-binding protein [Allobaculum mucilyticum]UNT97344.1 Jag N-terminal domain-containing protein [Allobaculum mucilyticum]